jgi:hypothetical protein
MHYDKWTPQMSYFSQFDKLDHLGKKFNTNKSSLWTKPDGSKQTKSTLLDKYEFFLNQLLLNASLNVLELGAGPDSNIGASARMWKEYFPSHTNLNIADINEKAKILENEGIAVHVGDLGDISFLTRLASRTWDFVIDDASHKWPHQILSFRYLFPSLRSGGVFIIEDLCTSFGKLRPKYSMDERYDPVDYFLAISRGCCGLSRMVDKQRNRIYPPFLSADLDILSTVSMVAWASNSCIIVKR